MADKPKMVAKKVRFYWSDGEHLEQAMVDHAQLRRVNDQFYLSFGQIRPPLIADASEVVEVEEVAMEIRPMARLVLPLGSMKSLLAMLKRNIAEE